MGQNIDQSSENAFYYPDEFRTGVTILLAQIPSFATGADNYSAQMDRLSDPHKIKLIFEIPDDIADLDKNKKAIADFIAYAKSSELYGVDCLAEKTIEFANAGSLSNLIEQYIADNPDELSDEVIEGIYTNFKELVMTYLSEGLIAEDPTQQALAQSKYPISSCALTAGYMALTSKYNGDIDLAVYYIENSIKDEVAIIIGTQEDEGEIVDPDQIDALMEIYDDLSVYSDGLDLNLILGDDNQQMSIRATNPLPILQLLKTMYAEKRVMGKEEVYEAYSAEKVAAQNFGDAAQALFYGDGDHENKDGYDHIKRAYRNHLKAQQMSIASDIWEQTGEVAVYFVPAGIYTTIEEVRLGHLYGHKAGALSIDEIDARVTEEVTGRQNVHDKRFVAN